MHKVPFFQELGSENLIRIGCQLQPVLPAEAIRDTTTGELPHSSYIMREGDRGDEMWVIAEGSVKIESGYGSERVELGKLREGDYFGEMAVLALERPGVHLPRFRSAYAMGVQGGGSMIGTLLYSLTYSAVQHLKRESPHIDATMRAAEAKLRNNRPSLFVDQQDNLPVSSTWAYRSQVRDARYSSIHDNPVRPHWILCRVCGNTTEPITP